jgi:hypothetical protein
MSTAFHTATSIVPSIIIPYLRHVPDHKYLTKQLPLPGAGRGLLGVLAGQGANGAKWSRVREHNNDNDSNDENNNNYNNNNNNNSNKNER